MKDFLTHGEGIYEAFQLFSKVFLQIAMSNFYGDESDDSYGQI